MAIRRAYLEAFLVRGGSREERLKKMQSFVATYPDNNPTLGKAQKRIESLKADIRSLPKEGKLRIVATPWAIVYVDGKKKGLTPLPPFYVPPGKRTILLVNERLNKKETKIVDVKPGEELTVRVDFM